MLESLKDAYTGYLQILHDRSDVDEGVVRETLASLGYSAAAIDEMLGGGPHMANTTVSSDSRGPAEDTSVTSISSRGESGRPDPSVVHEKSASSLESSAERETILRLHDEICHIQSFKSSSATMETSFASSSLSASSESSSSPLKASSSSLLLPWQPCSALRDDEKRLLRSSPASDTNSDFLDGAWESPIKNPERRDRYMSHLLALEEKLGVKSYSNVKKTRVNENIPLEVRGFMCRQRLQKLIFKQFGTNLRCSSKRYQGSSRLLDTNILTTPEEKPMVLKNREISRDVKYSDKRGLSPKPQLKCWRHSGKSLRVEDYLNKYQRCELCRKYAEGSTFQGKKGKYVMQQQKTAAAPAGEVCSVKMRPPVVLNVGSGRLNTRAVATTLLKREDRVKKAQVYLDEWYGSSKLDNGRDMTVWRSWPSVPMRRKRNITSS